MSDVTGEERPPTDTAPAQTPAEGPTPNAATAPDDTSAEDSSEADVAFEAPAVSEGQDQQLEPVPADGAVEELPAPEVQIEADTGVPAAETVDAPAGEVEVGEAEVGLPEPVEGEGEPITWQPVVDGDQIEWQPVVASDLAGNDQVGGPELEAQPDFDYPEGTELDAQWEAGLTDTTSPVSGNGAAGVAAAATQSSTAPARPTAGGRRAPRARPRPAVPEPPEEPGDRRRAASKTKRQVIILSILTVIVITVAVLGFMLSRDAQDKGNQATPGTTTATPSNTLPRLPDSALQTYSDDATGFTLKFSRTWESLRAPNADIRLVVNAGGNDAFQVRVAPIQTPATVENIANFKAVTDAIVFGDKSAKLVREQLVTVNGLLAYYYLFTFHDPLSNQEGVHAQYFVFEGNRMFILTFQSVPAEDFAKQANLWDQVAESFTVQPRPAPTTTAAPSETTSSTTVP